MLLNDEINDFVPGNDCDELEPPEPLRLGLRPDDAWPSCSIAKTRPVFARSVGFDLDRARTLLAPAGIFDLSRRGLTLDFERATSAVGAICLLIQSSCILAFDTTATCCFTRLSARPLSSRFFSSWASLNVRWRSISSLLARYPLIAILPADGWANSSEALLTPLAGNLSSVTILLCSMSVVSKFGWNSSRILCSRSRVFWYEQTVIVFRCILVCS